MRKTSKEERMKNNSETFYAVYVDDALYGRYWVGNRQSAKTVYEALRFASLGEAKTYVKENITPIVREITVIQKILVSYDIEHEVLYEDD